MIDQCKNKECLKRKRGGGKRGHCTTCNPDLIFAFRNYKTGLTLGLKLTFQKEN